MSARWRPRRARFSATPGAQPLPREHLRGSEDAEFSAWESGRARASASSAALFLPVSTASSDINIIAAEDEICGQREIPGGVVPRQLAAGGMPGGEAEGLDDGVVERRAHLANFFIRARGIHAIREQNHEKAAIRVEPQRSPGKPGVAEAMRGEIVARGGGLRGHIPSNRAGGIAEGYSRGEFLDGRAREQTAVGVDSTVQNHLREGGQIA